MLDGSCVANVLPEVIRKTLPTPIVVAVILAVIVDLAFVPTRSSCRLELPMVAREAVLRTDLSVLREVLLQYRADHGVFPERLELLVLERYLRRMPVDPFTRRSDTWRSVVRRRNGRVEVVNVRSGA